MGSGSLPGHPEMDGLGTVGRMRSGSNKWGLIVVKEPLLREGTGNDSCECLDLYDAFYAFSDPLPIGFTLINRIDDRTAHFKLCHFWQPSWAVIRYGGGHKLELDGTRCSIARN